MGFNSAFKRLMTLEFSPQFSKNTQIPDFIKIRPVGAELFHADGRTDGRSDMTKLIVVFRNFAHAPKNRHKMESLGCLLDPQRILTGFEIKNWYKLPTSKIISRVSTSPQLQ